MDSDSETSSLAESSNADNSEPNSETEEEVIEESEDEHEEEPIIFVADSEAGDLISMLIL